MTRRKAASNKKEPSTRANTSPESPMSLALSHVDGLLDKIQTGRVKSFDEANIATLRSLEQALIKEVYLDYALTLSNLKDALGGDEFYIEAYQNFTKPQMKLAVEYLKALKSLKHDDNSKKLRNKTVRQKKVKPAHLIVKKVLYFIKDPETNVESIDPAQIVGAAQLWIYNAKTRKLGCYWAKDATGLTVKGTTVLNYDEEKSTTKTLRKPKEQVWRFMSSGLKFWDAIRAVPQAIPPRLSRETVLLKVG